MSSIVELEVGDARAALDLANGGRVSSLRLRGDELLVTSPTENPMGWGAYPMVPWAGRVRRGRFSFAGRAHDLPITLGPHAIHGTAYLQPWSLVDDATPGSATIRTDLGDPWPFGGSVLHRAQLDAGHLRLTLTVQAGESAMPAMAGWHPWFRRSLSAAGPVELSFTAEAMYELDDDEIPTGELRPPSPGPWDNCFTALSRGPALEWPRGPTLSLTSSCDHWVVYTEPDHAVCVEPQTDAPDAFNRQPTVLQPAEQLVATFTIAWS